MTDLIIELAYYRAGLTGSSIELLLYLRAGLSARVSIWPNCVSLNLAYTASLELAKLLRSQASSKNS